MPSSPTRRFPPPISATHRLLSKITDFGLTDNSTARFWRGRAVVGAKLSGSRTGRGPYKELGPPPMSIPGSLSCGAYRPNRPFKPVGTRDPEQVRSRNRLHLAIAAQCAARAQTICLKCSRRNRADDI